MKSFNVFMLSLGLITVPAVSAWGQAGETLDEVTVTAQKRQQSAQDIPVTVTVISGEDLLQLGIESSNDIADYTPGLTISPVFGVGNIPNISLRGVGLNDFRDYHESPSAIYVDEVYKAALASLDFQLFDVDRVEVLKGPQGTLFGRNATGGLVQYLTKRPTEETEGYARLSAGDFGEMKLEAAVGGGLSETVSGRISAIYHKNDGIQQNVNPAGVDANQTDLTAVRGQLNFDLADSGSLLLSIETASNDNPGGNPYRYVPSFVGPDGLSDRDLANRDDVVGTSDLNDINVSGGLGVKSDYTAGTARLEWGFDSFDFVSISNFQDFEKRQVQDCDSSPADFCFTLYNSNTKQFSQELRLQGENDKLQWDAGLYYFDLDTDGNQALSGPIAGFFIAPGTNSTSTSFDTTTTSWAVFGQVEYRVTDAVSLIGGLRYTDDEKDMTQVFLLTDPVDALGFTGGVPYPKETQSEDNVSYSAKLTWDISDTTMVYGGISNAYKAGTFNSGFGPVDPAAYSVKPEELTSFEIGFKSELGGGRHRLTGAVFYYDYQDSQALVYRDLNQLLFNADAEITGAELEWTGIPTDGLEISAGISLLDTTVKSVQDGSGTIRDREMVLAPDLSMNAMARYTWDLSGGNALAAQIDGNYSSDVFFDNLNSPGLKEGAYTKLNARLSWLSSDERWEVAAWVKNLTDEAYRIYAFDLTADLGYIQDTYHAPRMYGVTVGVNF